MMAKRYEKHPDLEGKFRCKMCDYGDDGKSRQAVTNHFKKNHEEENAVERPVEAEVVEVVQPDQDADEGSNSRKVTSDDEQISIEFPDWLEVDFGEEGEPVVGSIPLPTKGFLRSLSANPEPAAQTPEALREWYKQQAKLLRYFLAGVVDPAVSWYGRGVTLNPEFTIERTKDDWALLESVGEQWFAYRQIAFPVSPDLLMLATVGALYVPAANKIRKERDPSRPRWGPVASFRRWRERRAIRRAIQMNPLNEGSDGFGSE